MRVEELAGEKVFLLVEVPVAVILTALLLWRYAGGHGRASWLVVGVAWFVSLTIPALMSLDVAETLSARCRWLNSGDEGNCPRHTADIEMVQTAWYLIYWLSFFLSWFFLPIVASYSVSGAFGPLKRLRAALIDRVMLWCGSLAFMAVCALFLVVRFKFTWFALMGILESLVNSFGLLVVILMLGHGLVEVPRNLWLNANHEQILRAIECRAVKLTERIDDARSALAYALGQLEATKRVFASKRAELGHERSKQISHFISVIESEVAIPEDNANMPKAIPVEAPTDVTEVFLENLRKKLKTRVIEFNRVNYTWQSKCRTAFELQDLLNWKRAALPNADAGTKLSFAFRSAVMPTFSRLVAVLAFAMSAIVVFAEVTVWSIQKPLNISLSPLDWAVHLPGKGVLYVQTVSFAVISYMALCTFYSLFRFKLFHVYELVPYHTDVYTLFLNSMICCRVAPVLAYNFLTAIHETNFAVDLLAGEGSPKTSFSLMAKSLEQIPIFGVGFNLYYPSVLLLFIVLNLTDFWGWMLKSFGANFAKLVFDDEVNEEDRQRGKRLLAVEWRRLNRKSLRDGPDDGGTYEGSIMYNLEDTDPSPDEELA
mmetsp:Transcript_11603/g.35448  ORF Transcript_11603/g.35448 Transcript_11603/m.35448 type:complete len:598 (+) Transcript_11603:135-1928(+)|eukprot:CAMPEP_0198723526 /NCGR_PEP_ID=MMETSP1475-20131203/1029_1 /TAXON_ID= ORGANISM="Unidentified sp., Strain CCMP1999" /NCGR_SAMPLE_ID=MMETSP1475 /ASSEMBLY_ACC=CAM_ASM_001111 /LENGTH=597 /DNA_ID=CAMNT_0044484685 /DNA_START=46 /DNA_END=1839 /DNA_ORIENTATION=-